MYVTTNFLNKSGTGLSLMASLVFTVILCTINDDKYIPVNRKLKFAVVIFIRKFLGNPIPLHMLSVLCHSFSPHIIFNG